jgi:outer membrane lipoprotein LolB
VTNRVALAAMGRLPVLLVAVAMLTMLTGCALRREDVVPVDWTQRRVHLLAMDTWQARGRIAVKAQGTGGQGDLAWDQQGASSVVRVSGPFGAGAYEIRWDPAMLRVASRNGEFSRAYSGADAAEQFLAEQLGWSFPASSVRYWLLGVPDPVLPARERFSADGRLQAIEQNGWSVTYGRFVERAGVTLPAKIAIESARARLRVIVDRWDF